MSRIGNRIIQIPEGVEINLSNSNVLEVKGPKGSLKNTFHPLIKIKIEDKNILTLRSSDDKKHKQLHGTTNSLIFNMVEGVTKGFQKILEINGVGYRCNITGNDLNLSLGFSHPVKLEIPQTLDVKAPKPTQIIISGADKQLVGAFAANIKKLRPVEPYKGKGVMYQGQFVRRKAGKSVGK